MKKILLLLIGLTIAYLSNAQSFKELYEGFPQNDRFSNLISLRNYQYQNPDHAICYFFLGEIYDQYMREVDPILLFDALGDNYQQMNTYFGLAKLKLDDKQARQDREYFGEMDLISDKNKAGLVDIVNEIDKRIEQAGVYYTNAKTVHDNYYRCINKYNECLFKFRDILGVYPNYKNLYLMATPELVRDVHNMALNFDSSLVFFDAYKESCTQFPELLNVNDYVLIPISTYRLEGLIETDFALPEVPMWDYKTWASKFLDLMNTDITNIRDGLIKNDKTLDAEIDKYLKNNVYSDHFNFYKVDLKFQNLIGKYDPSSLCNELINYKRSKLNYALHTRCEENSINDSLQFFLINKLRLFRDLARENVALNDEASALKASTNIDDVAKYISFFDQNYNGMDGFLRWCEVDKFKNDEIFDKNLNNLDLFIDRDFHKHDHQDSTLLYKNKKIAFGVQYPQMGDFKKDTSFITAVYPFQRNVLYQLGYTISTDSTEQPFLMKVGSGGKINWLNYSLLKEKGKIENHQLLQAQITSDSICHLIGQFDLKLNDSTKISKTYISKYNWNGDLIDHKILQSNLKPLFFNIDEINDQYLLVEKSEKLENTKENTYLFNVMLLKSNDSLIWQKQFNLKGDLVDINFTNSNFLLTLNYSEFSYNQTKLKANEGANGIANVFITRQGEVKYIYDYRSKNRIIAQNTFKISNNTFNLFGKEITAGKGDSYFYLLVDEDGLPDFNNRKDWVYKKYDFLN